MYLTNKKQLAKHKENEKHYSEKMQALKSELSIKDKILYNGSVIALVMIVSLIIYSIVV